LTAHRNTGDEVCLGARARYTSAVAVDVPNSPLSPDAIIDLTLIEYLLGLTPEERLCLNDRMLQTIQELRDGIAAATPHDAARPAGVERR
jgi:hypothetical protein